jgi:hypothetical protein
MPAWVKSLSPGVAPITPSSNTSPVFSPSLLIHQRISSSLDVEDVEAEDVPGREGNDFGAQLLMVPVVAMRVYASLSACAAASRAAAVQDRQTVSEPNRWLGMDGGTKGFVQTPQVAV